MSVCSLEWVAGVLVLSALFFFVPTVNLRQVILAACNFGFVATLMPDLPSWTVLLGFILSGFVVARILISYPRQFIVALYLCGLVAAFVILKQYAFIGFLHPATLIGRVIKTVGLSYIFFRQIHLVVGAYQEQIKELRMWDYLNYQLNLFGFVAGPIQRYRDFCASWSNLQPVLTTWESILAAYGRLFLGVLKVTVVAGFCLAKFDKWSVILTNPKFIGAESHGVALAKFLGVFYLYPIYIYFNFSGYCDMVIAAASLFGLKMPENFDRPYLSRNMIDYWTRWHRTLGFWIRDYLFTPIYKGVATHWPSRARSWAFLCYFIALFVAGVWHGSTWNFVVFGLLNGIGVAAAKLWEDWLIKRYGRQGWREYLNSKVATLSATLITLNFVCVTDLFVGMDIPTAISFGRAGLAILTFGHF